MGEEVKKALHLLDAFKVCIDEHPIVGKWITEILERTEQTEPQTDNPCEDCKRTGKDICWDCAIKIDCAWK